MKSDIEKSLEDLRNGGVILYPTDTIWGLGCDATNSSAVEKIFAIKKRTDSKSLIILVNSIEMLENHIDMIPAAALEILNVADRPLTIVYPSGRNLAAGVCAEDGSIGIRLTSDTFCRSLIGKLGRPIVSTSANESGQPSPRNFSEIPESIINAVDYVVTVRRNERRHVKASSVIRVEMNGVIKILRM